MWILLTILSSLFLGGYDILKKASLKENAVIPVLYIGSASSALFFGVLVILSHIRILEPGDFLFVPDITPKEHIMFFLKSIIVGSSWFFAYFALKHLPITIVLPIRATGPFWTIIGGLILFHERFSIMQWLGIVTVMTFFYIFSLAGKKEGINFKNNKWIFSIILATILGAISGLYDKFLLSWHHRMAVQAWFAIYMLVVFLPFLMFMWFPKRKSTTPFQWRWAIPMIGVFLTIADYLYFYALSYQESLIGIVSVLRRSSVAFSFVLGAIIFREVNLKRKALALTGILVGVILILLGSG